MMWGVSKILGGGTKRPLPTLMIQWSEVGFIARDRKPKEDDICWEIVEVERLKDFDEDDWHVNPMMRYMYFWIIYVLSLGHHLSWNAQVIPNPEGASNASLKLMNSIAHGWEVSKCDSGHFVAALFWVPPPKNEVPGRFDVCSFHFQMKQSQVPLVPWWILLRKLHSGKLT